MEWLCRCSGGQFVCDLLFISASFLIRCRESLGDTVFHCAGNKKLSKRCYNRYNLVAGCQFNFTSQNLIDIFNLSIC